MDVWTAPDGWPHRRFRLGPGTRGQLLFLGGRGDMIEKYLEAIAHLAGQGWAVTAFDWRGQGGSGRLLADEGVGHIDDFAQWTGDLAAFARDWRGEGAGPHVAVAHSMGGHLLLRALVEKAILLDAAVMTAPMFGLNGGVIPDWLAPLIVRGMARIVGPKTPAWVQNEKSAHARRLRQLRLTHSPDRYADEQWWRAQDQSGTLAAPSWGWLAAAYRSTAQMMTTPALAAMRVPVLILGTRTDRLVSPAAILRIAARLPDAALHMYGPEAAHELLRESDDVRIDALARIDAFLDQRAPVA